MIRISGHILGLLARFKYHIVIAIGVLLIGFFDENSIMKYVEYKYQIQDLKDEIAKYEKQYQADTKQLRELRRDPSAYAKVARERYFMKKADEDIFVLSDDEPSNRKVSKYETIE